MSGALARAYSNNPDLNAERASVRATDEDVPKAKAGWLPHISAEASAGRQYGVSVGDPLSPAKQNLVANPRGASATITQTIFDGLRTANSVSSAESSVLTAREFLRQTESATLLAAATAYMDVLLDSAVVGLERHNIAVLKVQLQDARNRFKVGEVLRTDVEQAKSALASGYASLALARSRLETSKSTYRQIIGVEPRRLQPARPLEKLLPARLERAIAIALGQNPEIIGALHQVDVDEAAVKIAEGALLPTASAQANVQAQDDATGIPGYHVMTTSVIGRIDIPIYQGGAEYAAVRQAKEQLGQARLAVDSQRRAVRSNLATAWGRLAAARASIPADRANIKAAKFALNGVREEAKDGMRTTRDILDAQQNLLDARIRLVTDQHDRVVASYRVFSAMGLLTARRLGLAVARYNPAVHYRQTKNRFFGVSTPDGR